MRTKDELLDFLFRVVGEEYIIVTSDDNGGEKVDIKPYDYQISQNNGYDDSISGSIRFKGEYLNDFNNSGRDMVKTLTDCMNHAYSQSIKDCLVSDPDMLSRYKMSRFKFS